MPQTWAEAFNTEPNVLQTQIQQALENILGMHTPQNGIGNQPTHGNGVAQSSNPHLANQPGGDVATSLLNINLRGQSRELAIQGRPPKDRRFSGQNKNQDFEAFVTQFEKATDLDGITDQIRYMELKHWVSGPAAIIVSQFESEKDSSLALKMAMDRLAALFGRKLLSARQILNELLTGPKFVPNDTDQAQVFIAKLEKAYTKAVSSGREASFSTPETYSEILRKKLPHLITKWATKMTEHQLNQNENGDSGVGLPFTKFLEFLHTQNLIGIQREALRSDPNTINTTSAKATSATKKPSKQIRFAATEVEEAIENGYEAGLDSASSDSENEECSEVGFAVTTTSRPKNKNKPQQQKSGPKTHPPHTQTTKPQENGGSGTSSQQNKPSHKPTSSRPPCLACEGGKHDLDYCREFMKKAEDEKREFVMAKGICFLCLTKGHVSQECKQDVKCKECQGRHNSVFHYSRTQEESREDEENSA